MNPFLMFTSSRPVFGYLAMLGLLFSVAGCEKGPQAKFKYRKETKDLIPEAEKAVVKTLEDGFGTPSELVAWERFPVSYGGMKGEVASVDDKSITVTVENGADQIKKESPLIWITGALASGKAANGVVRDFDPKTSKLILSTSATPPAVGDQFIVGFGQGLALGRHVYMKNCLHCHGVTGDGDGPTAQFLNPRPRDYRSGEFKFTSTKKSEKATRDDLHRIIQFGIPGTYMPSFLLLGEKETAAVVEYVRWLAIRGEFEKRLTAEVTSDYAKSSIASSASKAEVAYKEKLKNNEKDAEKPKGLSAALKAAAGDFKKYSQDDFPGVVEEIAKLLADNWTRAEDPETVLVPSVPRVPDTPESRERGRLLYLSDNTKCYTCHGMLGKGDGNSTEDFWKDPFTNEPYPVRGLHDIWGNPLKPRNLTLGQYRGGRRPIDLFRRLYVGIKATPMPAFGGGQIKDEQLWDIVNFVMSLPYTSRQPSAEPAPKGHVAKLEDKPSK